MRTKLPSQAKSKQATARFQKRLIVSLVLVALTAGVGTYAWSKGWIPREITAPISQRQDLGNGWEKDARGVYHANRLFTEADPQTITVFPSGEYAADQNHIYRSTAYWPQFRLPSPEDHRVRDADRATFEDLKGGWAKDKNHVYYGGEIVEYADPDTFSLFSNFAFGTDGTYVYEADYDTYHNTSDPSKIPPDTDVFAELGGKWLNLDRRFAISAGITTTLNVANGTALGDIGFKDNNFVFITPNDGLMGQVRGIDAPTANYIGVCSSVEVYQAHYLKDKDHVFKNTVLLDQIDGASFQYLGLYENHEGMPVSRAYAKDKNAVYSGCGEPIANADPRTFTVLKDGYAKDRTHVWFQGRVVEGADITSFTVSKDGFAKDKYREYEDGIDPGAF